MQKLVMTGLALGFTLAICGPALDAQEQQTAAPKFLWTTTDMAITYTTEASKVTPGGNTFWDQGGSIDAGIGFYRGFGLATNLTVDYASSFAPGLHLRETNIVGGPRYTYNIRPNAKHASRLFVEAFAGGVHASGGIFPSSKGIGDRASAFAWQVGGGLDINLTKHVALRAFEADYGRTYLPNNGINVQDHLRLAIGVAYHVRSH
jgi:hypothetical protein